VLSVGQKVQVEITKIDDRGKLSLAPVVDDADGGDTEGRPEDDTHVDTSSEGQPVDA